MSIPTIAIVGRPNVGKSTLFNRLLKKRKAIVHAREGITRDRVYGEMEWTGHVFRLIDTGGFIPVDVDEFTSAVREHARQAMAEADLVLFMVDGREDPTASDRVLAQLVRESGKPVIVAVNKCDSKTADVQLNKFYEFGMEPMRPVSALTGRLSGDLLDEIVSELDLKRPDMEQDDKSAMRLTIVGMPNVGKSSLANALLQREQSIVTPVPGTTRDSVDSHLRWHGKTVTLVDTAGLRKKSKAMDDIEFYSTVRSRKAIQSCDVALVLIDGAKEFGKQDKSIASLVIKNGKGLILIVNKWDLVEKETHTLMEYTKEIRRKFRALEHYPILFISALTGQRISKVLETANVVFENSRKKVSTNGLNTFLKSAQVQRQPPAEKGKVIRIKYITQVHHSPPVFALFTNYPKLVPVTYKRYLENRLRAKFDFEGVPITLSFRRK